MSAEVEETVTPSSIVEQDIIDSFDKMLAGKKPVHGYRYWLFGDLYDGKYHDTFGYQKEYQDNYYFIVLINQLVLTDTALYEQFKKIRGGNYADFGEILKQFYDNPQLQIEEQIKENEKAIIEASRKRLKNEKAIREASLERLKNKKAIREASRKRLQEAGKNYFDHKAPNTNKSDPQPADAIAIAKAEKKRDYQSVATTVATWVAIGEGAVAGASLFDYLTHHMIGIAGLSLNLPLSILTTLCGAFCNYYLVKQDTYEMLEKIFIDDFFKEIGTGTENSVNPIKDLAILLGACSVATGFSYAALSADCLFNKILQPLFISILHLSPTLASQLAFTASFFPVFFTAIGFSAIFFHVIANFIKEEKWTEIKPYIKKEFLAPYHEAEGFSGHCKYIAACCGKIFMLLLGFAVNACITVASFYVFQSDGKDLLNLIANANLACIVSKVLVTINVTISAIFNIEKIHEVFAKITPSNLCNLLKSFPWRHLIEKPLNMIVWLLKGLINLVCDPKKLLSYLLHIIGEIVAELCILFFSLPNLFLSAIIGLPTALIAGAWVSIELIRCFFSLLTTPLVPVNKAVNYFFNSIKEYLETAFGSLKKNLLASRHLIEAPQRHIRDSAALFHNTITDFRYHHHQETDNKAENNLEENNINENKPELNPLQKSVNEFYSTLLTGTYASIAANGIGQAMLMLHGSGALQTSLGKVTAQSSVFFSQFTVSVAPNVLAAQAALENTAKVEPMPRQQLKLDANL